MQASTLPIRPLSCKVPAISRAPQACRSPLYPAQLLLPLRLCAGNDQGIQAAGAKSHAWPVVTAGQNSHPVCNAGSVRNSNSHCSYVDPPHLSSVRDKLRWSLSRSGLPAWACRHNVVATFVVPTARSLTSYVRCSLLHNISLPMFCLSPTMVVETAF